jgi:hypothetical protein
MVFLNRIFGPKMEEAAGGWRRLHNEELHNWYTSQNIVTVIMEGVMGGTNRKMRNACKILVGKSDGKRPLGRPRRR